MPDCVTCGQPIIETIGVYIPDNRWECADCFNARRHPATNPDDDEPDEPTPLMGDADDPDTHIPD